VSSVQCSSVSRAAPGCSEQCSSVPRAAPNCSEQCSSVSRTAPDCSEQCSSVPRAAPNCAEQCSHVLRAATGCSEQCSSVSRTAPDCSERCSSVFRAALDCSEQCSSVSRAAPNCSEQCSHALRAASFCSEQCSSVPGAAPDSSGPCSRLLRVAAVRARESRAASDCSEQGFQLFRDKPSELSLMSSNSRSSGVIDRSLPEAHESDVMHRAENIATLQKEDPDIGVIVRLRLQKAEEPTLDEMLGESEITKALWAQWFRLVVLNGVVYRADFGSKGRPQCYQLLVPTVLKEDIIRSCHTGMAGGHLGVRKTLDQVRRRAFWIGWRREVERHCRRCIQCNCYHRGKLPRTAPLQPTVVGAPLERMSLDLCGPFPLSSRGNVYRPELQRAADPSRVPSTPGCCEPGVGLCQGPRCAEPGTPSSNSRESGVVPDHDPSEALKAGKLKNRRRRRRHWLELDASQEQEKPRRNVRVPAPYRNQPF